MDHPAALSAQIGTTLLTLVRGDITMQDTDAVVNAANSSLMGGGGVDGAIHRAGGPQILAECEAIVGRQGNCPTGEAVITTGGRLPARYVIHTVGPVWHGGAANEEHLLANTYHNSLALAVRHGLKSIAFPSISTGAYGFPVEQAARIALETVIAFVEKHPALEEIRFIVFSKEDYRVYADIFPIAPSE